MLKKRIIGVVTVRNGLAVQSFGYNNYLPLGSPQIVVENLDRWGADEIIVQCIDRSSAGLGPDFSCLEKISEVGITTPLIYGGGVRHVRDAIDVISCGADRLIIDALVYHSPENVSSISQNIGTQALVLSLPVKCLGDQVCAYNYLAGDKTVISDWWGCFDSNLVSEIMIIDAVNEGSWDGFDERICSATLSLDKPVIYFGGLASPDKVNRVLNLDGVVAVGVGNYLNYRENAIRSLKQEIDYFLIRQPVFFDFIK